jgi:disulfide bond formation protein DsbB
MALASISSAWFFELALGYAPCKLCLLQRWPYYIALPVGLGAYLAGGWSGKLGRSLLVAFVLIFVVSAVLGAYHAGVEWKFWAGPTDCSGRLTDGPSTVLDLRKSLQSVKVVRCDDAPLRILGLSFAGWNVIVSVLIAGMAVFSTRQASH